MKKLISIISSIAMLAISAPAIANPNLDPRWGNNRNIYSPYRGQHRGQHRGGVSTEGAIIIGLGALLLGNAIANNNNRRRNNEVIIIDRGRYNAPQGCEDIIQHDYYGNPYVVDRRCWYNR